MSEEPPVPPAHDAPPLYLRGWFGKIRRRRWTRLFLFEFFVVLSGVLAAQGLQQYFSTQAAERRADDALDALQLELATLGFGVEMRQRTYPCTVWRLSELEKRVRGEDVLIPHQSYHPPERALVTFPGWGSDTVGSMRRYLDENQLQDIALVSELADQFDQLQSIELESWAAIHRLSEDLGEPSSEDYSAAKEGLVKSKLLIGQILRKAQVLDTKIKALGAEPNVGNLDAMRSASDTCAKLMGFPLDVQMEQLAEDATLLTGQRVDTWYPRSRAAQRERAAAAAR